ncbi:hypothetical protein OUZ56_029883 [Daphnia magna]|uniref:Uncharacterized protein n=1 Tax=Daphnia magna TaxID=35525 RepID=A0ABR0B848_9CRUS|nr:hypothetical protein OUZ56_029883 [Daphnia magna]
MCCYTSKSTSRSTRVVVSKSSVTLNNVTSPDSRIRTKQDARRLKVNHSLRCNKEQLQAVQAYKPKRNSEVAPQRIPTSCSSTWCANFTVKRLVDSIMVLAVRGELLKVCPMGLKLPTVVYFY